MSFGTIIVGIILISIYFIIKDNGDDGDFEEFRDN